MSWQVYVDDQLVGTKNVSKGAIIGHDGATWATSPGFAVTPEEGAALVNGYANPRNFFANGVTVGGIKYLVLKAGERSVYGKKGTAGCACVKTGQTILIGIYGEGQQPGAAANTVEKVADYLIENGY